jgi:hypothetical protein
MAYPASNFKSCKDLKLAARAKPTRQGIWANFASPACGGQAKIGVNNIAVISLSGHSKQALFLY